MIAAAQDFLARLDLTRFGTDSEADFRQELNRVTLKLQREFPGKGKNWGAARKVLNIFLHNAFYNHYLRRHYRLAASEKYYEVPLDSAVTKGLRWRAPRGHLPAWRGLKHLTLQENHEFQKFASSVAASLGTSRVHLDAVLWPEQR